MIDFENYERVTVKDNRVNNRIPLEQISGVMTPLCDLYNRLAELEDLIEKKKLIPNCLIIKGDSGEWYVLHFNGSFFNAYQCRTRQEAEMKKEELMESEEE